MTLGGPTFYEPSYNSTYSNRNQSQSLAINQNCKEESIVIFFYDDPTQHPKHPHRP